MTSGELWIPPTPDLIPDPRNPFDMMHVQQRILLAIDDPDERAKEAEKFYAMMAEEALDLERLKDVTVGCDVAVIPSSDPSSLEAHLLEREIGLIGKITGFGYAELSKRVLGLTIALDVTYIFNRENPDDADMLLRSARVPITYVKYIEFSSAA